MSIVLTTPLLSLTSLSLLCLVKLKIIIITTMPIISYPSILLCIFIFELVSNFVYCTLAYCLTNYSNYYLVLYISIYIYTCI
ncbi:hypothetical protein F4703DRAFT_1874517, partial [Phycomyces blakesleeanus]